MWKKAGYLTIEFFTCLLTKLHTYREEGKNEERDGERSGGKKMMEDR